MFIWLLDYLYIILSRKTTIFSICINFRILYNHYKKERYYLKRHFYYDLRIIQYPDFRILLNKYSIIFFVYNLLCSLYYFFYVKYSLEIFLVIFRQSGWHLLDKVTIAVASFKGRNRVTLHYVRYTHILSRYFIFLFESMMLLIITIVNKKFNLNWSLSVFSKSRPKPKIT